MAVGHAFHTWLEFLTMSSSYNILGFQETLLIRMLILKTPQVLSDVVDIIGNVMHSVFLGIPRSHRHTSL